MAVEAKKDTVKMKFVGFTKEDSKIVELPIPLVSNSQKLAETLKFSRQSSKGPLMCDVPIKWVGSLLDIGGNWQINEELTSELSQRIAAAKQACCKEMEAFALENKMVCE